MRSCLSLTTAVIACAYPGTLRAEDISANPTPPFLTGFIFSMPQIEEVPTGKARGQEATSVNFLDIPSVTLNFPENFQLSGSLRNDSVQTQPGVGKTQYWGVRDLFATWEPSRSLKILVGNIPYWGPVGGEPSITKWTEVQRTYLGNGGPEPGFVGALVDKKANLAGVQLELKAIAGTGDRYITSSFKGPDFPNLCRATNKEGCGLVAGISVGATPFKGFTVTAQQTLISNTSGLKNEQRSDLAFQYQKDILGVTAAALVEGTNNAHYLGGARSVRSMTETLSAQRPIGHFLLEGYASETKYKGAIKANFALAGVGLTYHLSPKAGISVEPYIGRELVSAGRYEGIWTAFIYNF